AVLGPRFLEIVDAVMAGSARGGGGSNGGPQPTPEEVLVERIRTIAAPGDVVLVPVNGDRAVPDLTPQRACPSPKAPDGSPGGDPADGAAAVTHLEAQRRRGARWFALPS